MSTTFTFKLMPTLSRTDNNQQLTINKRRGFTLIELLVVIAIIGILASFAIASFTSAQAKGRDSRRKADLDAVKKALELFKSDTTGGAKYPNTTTGSLVTLTYIRALPTDPSSAANYWYTPFQSNGTSACSGGGDTLALASAGNCETFQLTACIENNNDTSTNVITKPGTGDGSTCTGTKVYRVNNP